MSRGKPKTKPLVIQKTLEIEEPTKRGFIRHHFMFTYSDRKWFATLIQSIEYHRKGSK